MMSSGSSMPGSAVGAGASSLSQHAPQHAQHQHQHPYQHPPPTASGAPHNNGNNNNYNNNHVATAAITAPSTTTMYETPQLHLPARDWSMMTRTIAHYERLEQIGEGTYGQVYKARCKDTEQIVAMKKIRVHHGKDWGMPPTVIREIKILKRLQHPNLVRMMEVVSSKGVEHLDEEDESTDVRFQKKSKDRVVDAREGYKGNLFLVLEYVSHDLTGLMDIAYQFTPVQVKSIFKQLLEALDYMHQNKYVHRDIKSSNILLDHHFRLKLADFGLARCIEPPILDNLHDRASSQEFTNKVITLWYRPPEILLGATQYGPPVDVWSAGCILAELLIGKPLFTGKTEMDQLQLIFDLLGTPSPKTWDGLKDLKLLRTGQVTLPPEEKRKEPRLRQKYTKKVPQSVTMALLEKLLELDPAKRLTAGRALQNRYFLVEPIAPDRPEDLGPIQVKDHFHEFQTKRKRRQAKAEAEKSRESAKAAGMDDEQAQEQFDSCYRKLMAKVAAEGIDAFGSSSKKDGANRKDKYKDRKDRDRKNDWGGSARDDRRENKKSDRSHRDRDRPDDDRRRNDSESRNRDPEDDAERRRRRKDNDDRISSKDRKPSSREDSESRRRGPDEDAERRRHRKEHDERVTSKERERPGKPLTYKEEGASRSRRDAEDDDGDRKRRHKEHYERTAKDERRPSMEEGEEKGDGEKRKSRKDRDRSSRERRSSRDHHDRKDKDRDRSGRSKRESDKSSRRDRDRDHPDDDSKSKKRRRKDSDVSGGGSSHHRKSITSDGDKDRQKGRNDGPGERPVPADRDHRSKDDVNDKRDKGRTDRDDRGRGERDRSVRKDRPPFDEQHDGDRRGRHNDDRRRHDDRRRGGDDDRRDSNRRGDPYEGRGGGGRHHHGRDMHPGGPWNGPPGPMDFPPPGRRGGPGPGGGPGGPSPRGHYGPVGGGPPGAGGPPFRRDDRDAGPPRGGGGPDRDEGRRNNSPGRRRDHGRGHNDRR